MVLGSGDDAGADNRITSQRLVRIQPPLELPSAFGVHPSLGPIFNLKHEVQKMLLHFMKFPQQKKR